MTFVLNKPDANRWSIDWVDEASKETRPVAWRVMSDPKQAAVQSQYCLAWLKKAEREGNIVNGECVDPETYLTLCMLYRSDEPQSATLHR